VTGITGAGRIRLVLYPDSATKTSQTGHVGSGFASARTIIEIFNDSVQLDPYHEVAHIVGGERGSPPAVLDEGFAVYVSQSLGADALKYLGAPGATVSQVVCGYLRSGTLIPLGRLFRFTDRGGATPQRADPRGRVRSRPCSDRPSLESWTALPPMNRPALRHSMPGDSLAASHTSAGTS